MNKRESILKRLEWLIYGSDYVLRQKIKNLYIIPYCKREMLSIEECNKDIKKKLAGEEPFFVGRIGLFELAAMRAFEFHNKDKYELVMKQIYDCAGFYPLDISLGNPFLDLMRRSLKNCDLLACSHQLCENYFINRYTRREAKGTVSFDALEPWRFENPWSSGLRGKKVLVVTPFVESVNEQYKNRDKLFQNTNILPEFELYTYKALQTTGDLNDERFANWFEALEYMYQEIMRIDFDVVLLGCGAYGFPLGAKIKNAGKQAIHMGGVLQILFGIMGKRWDGTGPNSNTQKIREDIAKYYNKYWNYPKQSETPISASRVEYGPYWK